MRYLASVMGEVCGHRDAVTSVVQGTLEGLPVAA